MTADQARASLAELVRSSGLADEGSGVVMCSGGADSAALAAGLAGARGPAVLLVLHLNYGLRPEADSDERACEALCAELGIELVAEHPELPAGGNLQAAARDARYAAAERLRRARGLDWIATGHTRTDLAETVIYRLASSPGSRGLLGLRARRGAIIRPLLGVGRDRVRELVAAGALPFRDDASNAEPSFARNRIRNEVLPVLAEIGAVEANVAETQAELIEEAEALEELALRTLEEAGATASGSLPAGELSELGPALGRLALRAMAERAAGHPVALGRARAAEIRRLADHPEGGVVELGGGVEGRIEHGQVRFAGPAPSERLQPVVLAVPGSCRFGTWEVRAEIRAAPGAPLDLGADAAVLDASTLGDELVVRAWRDGDRMRPLGLGGSKSLQDLFTDRRVPRSLRRALPVITSGERVVWIAGVAVSEQFAARPGCAQVVLLTAQQPASTPPAGERRA